MHEAGRRQIARILSQRFAARAAVWGGGAGASGCGAALGWLGFPVVPVAAVPARGRAR